MAAKSGGQEVRVGEVFVECAEKMGFPGFGFFRQGNNYALRGRKRLPEEKCNSRDQRMAAGTILNSAGESKMEISVERKLKWPVLLLTHWVSSSGASSLRSNPHE
jgi:hypothetical protein